MKLASQNQNGLFWDWCVCICRCNFNLKVALYFGISLGIPCLPSLFSKPNIWRFTNDRERERDMLITCVYTIVTFACAKLSLIPKPQSHKSSFEKIYWSNFFFASDQHKTWREKRRKMHRIYSNCIFKNIRTEERRRGKNSTFHKITAAKGSHFDLTITAIFPPPPSLSISSKLSLL